MIWDGDKGSRCSSLYQVAPYCVRTYIVNMKPYTCEEHLKYEYNNRCLAKAAEYDVIYECKPRNIHRNTKDKCENIEKCHIFVNI